MVVSDDMDALRKVPEICLIVDLLEEDLDKPVSSVRDPFGEYESFGAHNNARARAFLDSLRIRLRVRLRHRIYRSGRFDPVLLRVLERFDEVQAIMLPTLGEARRATYSPFLPISPKTGRVLQAPTLERNPRARHDRVRRRGRNADRGPGDRRPRQAAVASGLGGSLDGAGVDYEMCGKDLVNSVRVSSRICKVLGGEPPETFIYELFMDEANQKISKSKGNGLSMEDWLRYGEPESLAYYMFTSPKSAKRLYFDVIPRATDDYCSTWTPTTARRPRAATVRQSAREPGVEHPRRPPPGARPVSFSLLLNLVSAASASDKAMLWAFIAGICRG